MLVFFLRRTHTHARTYTYKTSVLYTSELTIYVGHFYSEEDEGVIKVII
jgi:hypothetical protein